MFIINSTNSRKSTSNNDFTGCEITHDYMGSIPTHCPFKGRRRRVSESCCFLIVRSHVRAHTHTHTHTPAYIMLCLNANLLTTEEFGAFASSQPTKKNGLYMLCRHM